MMLFELSGRRMSAVTELYLYRTPVCDYRYVVITRKFRQFPGVHFYKCVVFTLRLLMDFGNCFDAAIVAFAVDLHRCTAYLKRGG